MKQNYALFCDEEHSVFTHHIKPGGLMNCAP